MIELQVERFFKYARERYLIRQRRLAGDLRPWTQDIVLQNYRFCNVFREHDKVTEWFRETVRNSFRADPRIVFNTIMFRFVNKIETGERLLEQKVFHQYNPLTFRRVLAKCKPMLGGAYMIKTPPGKDKITGLIEIFKPFVELGDFELGNFVRALTTMETMVSWLTTFPWVGSFMAYEVACDLQYTLLFNPTDTITWANPGPGAKRGLNRILVGTPDSPEPPSKLVQQHLQTMQMLLARSLNVYYWPGNWPHWDMRTVEHTLCEFDKYDRTLQGQGKPKQRFNGV